MPRVSKSKIEIERSKEISEHFSYLISSLSQKGEIENFVDEFLTKEEKIMLAKRLVLFMLLKRNYSPTNIRSGLKMSHETIRIYQNQLDNKNAQFHKTIERLVNREKSKEFFSKLDEILKPVENFLKAKTNMKARARFMP